VLPKWSRKKVRSHPKVETVAAMYELEEGKGKSFTGVDELLADLNADD